MDKSGLTKVLAFGGTGLAWLPILAPVFFFLARFLQAGEGNFDFLMPGELFPLALAGGALLIWAAVRARSLRVLIAGGLGAATGLLFLGQGLAVVTGLASGETEPGGWQWAFVLACLAAYALFVAAMGVGGALLLRRLYRQG